MNPVKIVLDTDIGSEMTDAATLVLAAISPEIDLLGVSTVTHDSVFRASVAKKILKLLGKSSIPVASGFGTNGEHEREKRVVFPEGYEPSKELDSRPGWQLILDLINKNTDVVLVGIGTTTNIAKALDMDPLLPKKVKKLILMGGMLDVPTFKGKSIPRGFEYNFCSDSASAEKIFKAGFNLTLLPGDLTFQEEAPWTKEEQIKLTKSTIPIIQLLSQLQSESLSALEEGLVKAKLPLEFHVPWVNDEFVMSYIIKPEMFDTKDIHIKWELPDKYPRLIISESGIPIKLVHKTDFAKTRKFILERLFNIR